MSKWPADLRYLITKLYFDSSFQNYFFVNHITTQVLDLFQSASKTVGWLSWLKYLEHSDLWVEYNWQCKRKCSVISISAPQGFNVKTMLKFAIF